MRVATLGVQPFRPYTDFINIVEDDMINMRKTVVAAATTAMIGVTACLPVHAQPIEAEIIHYTSGAGKTAGGLSYFINEYPPTKNYGRSERVAYVQLPKAVAYIVFSADEESAYRKHKVALEETVKSMLSLEVDYPGKSEKAE